MKKFFTKKKISIIILALVLGIAATTATMALMTDVTKEVVNHFNPAKVETHIDEKIDDQPVKPDTAILKSPVIVNDGPSNAFIRARITISPSTSGVMLLAGSWSKTTGADKVFTKSGEVFNGTAFVNNGNWIYCKADGFYYYTLPVESGKSTAAVFDAVVLKENADVTIYQEAVLATDVYSAQETVSVGEIQKLFENVNK